MYKVIGAHVVIYVRSIITAELEILQSLPGVEILFWPSIELGELGHGLDPNAVRLTITEE